MEPVKASVKFVIETHVVAVDEIQRVLSTSYKDKDGNFSKEEETLGWFVWLNGSQERLFLGKERPELYPGDKVKVTIERVS